VFRVGAGVEPRLDIGGNLGQLGSCQVLSQSVPRAQVLLIEDDPHARAALTRMLTLFGVSVHAVPTLAEARSVLEQEPAPMLVVCDLSLPDGSGIELLKWVHGAKPWLCARICVLTGGVIEADDQRFLRDANLRVLHKPAKVAELLAVVASVKEAQNAAEAEGVSARLRARRGSQQPGGSHD
jgi:DNA-binding response OmpR family regulator